MRPDSARWREVSASEFAHERAGLAHVRDLLPDRAPFRAWSNFEFRDSRGRWYEVDLLVLGESRLHLVELKHYRGKITGSAYRWRRNGCSEDSPVVAARRKAQRLASVIQDAARTSGLVDPATVPFVQQAVFLHAADGRCELSAVDRVTCSAWTGRSGGRICRASRSACWSLGRPTIGRWRQMMTWRRLRRARAATSRARSLLPGRWGRRLTRRGLRGGECAVARAGRADGPPDGLGTAVASAQRHPGLRRRLQHRPLRRRPGHRG